MSAAKIFALSFALKGLVDSSFSASMSKSTAVMRQLADNTRLLKGEQKQLNNAWTESQSKIANYSRQIQNIRSAYSQGQMTEANYKASIAQIGESMRKAGMSADEYMGHLQRLRQEMNSNQRAIEKMQALQNAQRAAQTRLGTAKESFMSTLYTAGMVAAPAYSVIDTAMEFEAAMSKVRAITRASDADMEKLTSTAQKLGATTVFSAQQSAEAMSYLGMAGWNASQIMSGMPGLLALAAAGGTDLARTADIISDDLTAFGLSADQAAHMADVFAVTVTRTNTNVEMMGETMKYAAPVAKAFGATMEETAALTGIMANSGVKASQAGTSLRAGFLRLAGPPKKASKAMDELGISLSDVSREQQEAQAALQSLGINMDNFSGSPAHKMVAILSELREKTAGLSGEEKLATMQAIFGTNAATGWLNVLEAGPEVFNDLVTQMENCDGEAEKMAAVMMDNAKGALDQFKSAIEGTAIAVGNVFLPYITDMLHSSAEMSTTITNWVREHQELVLVLGTVAVGATSAAIAIKAYAVVSAFLATQIADIRMIAAAWMTVERSQRLATLATTAQTKALYLLKASSTPEVFKNMATGILNAANTIKASAVSTGQAVLNMARSFSITAAINGAQTAMLGFGRAIAMAGKLSLSAMFSPLGIAIMAIAGAAYLVYSNWSTVGPYFMSLWQTVQNAFAQAWALIQPTLNQLQLRWLQLQDALNQSGAINTIISIFSTLAQILGGVVVGAIFILINVLIGGLTTAIGVAGNIINGFIGVLTGVITFITGVFTGNWAQAWEGIKTIFSSVFNAIKGIADSILGGISNTISGIANGIRSLTGGGGGTDVSHNARGGIYNKGAFLTTFAEDSPEAAIPLDGSKRALSLWQQAGQMLGVLPSVPADYQNTGAAVPSMPTILQNTEMIIPSIPVISQNTGAAVPRPVSRPVAMEPPRSRQDIKMEFAPTININGGGNSSDVGAIVKAALREQYEQFMADLPRLFEDMQANKRRLSYE